MDYTEKLVIAAKNYLRLSTCKCKYKERFCPQAVLQSLVDEYSPVPTKKKKGAK